MKPSHESTTDRMLITTMLAVMAFALAGCADQGVAESTAPEAAKASATAVPTQAEATGVVCRQAGVSNSMATFSSCSDDQVWALLCRERDHAWNCECKVADTVASTEKLTEKPYELTLDDPQLLRQNAAAATNEICGFSITYEPRS